MPNLGSGFEKQQNKAGWTCQGMPRPVNLTTMSEKVVGERKPRAWLPDPQGGAASMEWVLQGLWMLLQVASQLLLLMTPWPWLYLLRLTAEVPPGSVTAHCHLPHLSLGYLNMQSSRWEATTWPHP